MHSFMAFRVERNFDSKLKAESVNFCRTVCQVFVSLWICKIETTLAFHKNCDKYLKTLELNSFLVMYGLREKEVKH